MTVINTESLIKDLEEYIQKHKKIAEEYKECSERYSDPVDAIFLSMSFTLERAITRLENLLKDYTQ